LGELWELSTGLEGFSRKGEGRKKKDLLTKSRIPISGKIEYYDEQRSKTSRALQLVRWREKNSAGNRKRPKRKKEKY